MIDTSKSSPNYTSGRTDAIQAIILHATIGSYASSLGWLCSTASKASTHYLIRKDGYTASLVADHDTAWHAGRARWANRNDVNNISIGIELENLTGLLLADGTRHGPDPYPPAQLAALTGLVRTLLTRYRLPPSAITTHAAVARPVGRKTDPVNFPLDAWRLSLMSGAMPRSYRARTEAHVRSGASRADRVLLTLARGEPWSGVEVKGERVEFSGWGASDIWIADDAGRAVWSLLLEAAA